jgi:hypothetical protein
MFVFKSSNVLICPVTLPVVIARARVLVLLTRDAPPIVIHVRIRNGLRIASTPPVVIPIFYAIVIEFGPHIFRSLFNAGDRFWVNFDDVGSTSRSLDGIIQASVRAVIYETRIIFTRRPRFATSTPSLGRAWRVLHSAPFTWSQRGKSLRQIDSSWSISRGALPWRFIGSRFGETRSRMLSNSVVSLGICDESLVAG